MNTNLHRPELVEKRQLRPAELAAIKDLASICDVHDRATLRVNVDSLAARSGDAPNDFLCYQDGMLIGALALYVFGNSEAEASGMVHPNYRRRGIFRALVGAGVAELRRRGIPKLLFFCDHATLAGLATLPALGARFDHAEHKMELGQPQMPPAFDARLRVERMTAADVDAVAHILTRCFGGVEADARPHLATQVASDTHHTYVAWLDTLPISALTLIRGGGEAGIYGFGVLPEHRGRGYGRQILARVIQLALAGGPERIILEVAPENDRALGLYLSVGFRETHRYDYYAIEI
jgi:ribosomal protein S18 acetylase RimI-like enzyme